MLSAKFFTMVIVASIVIQVSAVIAYADINGPFSVDGFKIERSLLPKQLKQQKFVLETDSRGMAVWRRGKTRICMWSSVVSSIKGQSVLLPNGDSFQAGQPLSLASQKLTRAGIPFESVGQLGLTCDVRGKLRHYNLVVDAKNGIVYSITSY